MIEIIWNILKHTPTYVYVIFIYLMYTGLQARKEQVISIFKPVALAAVFSYMAIDMLIRSFQMNATVLGIWLFSLSLGIFLGWLQFSRKNIQVDKEKKLIKLPGTWSSLFLILIIFSSKYFFGFMYFRSPHLFQNLGFQVFALLISGSTSGLFIGRLANCFYRLKVDQHTDLSLKVSKTS